MRRISIANFITYAVVVSITLCLAGCGKKAELVAKVDNKGITATDFKNRISKLPERYQNVILANKKKFLEEVIVDALLYKEALRRKLEADEDVIDLIEEARKKILITKLLKVVIDDAVVAGDSDVRAYYDTNSDDFKTPEAVRASHIIVKTEKEAKEIVLELANGRNFEDLARARSFDPTSSRGGDIGFILRGQVNPDFEKACFALKEGEISDIVKTNFGYHIIKLTERRSASLESFDDVKGRIRQNLRAVQKKKLFNELVERLKNASKIVIYEDSPFLSEPEYDLGNIEKNEPKDTP